MTPDSQYKDKIDFYLSSLDELGEVLINQEGSTGITKAVLRIILGTMMASKGAVIGIKRTRCNILSSHGVKIESANFKIDTAQKKSLLKFKNSNLNKTQFKRIFNSKESDTLSNFFKILDPSVVVPLFHRDYIDKCAKELLPQLKKYDDEWLGFRPTLPDFLPILGPSINNKNIIYAFGHHHLGWTLGAVTGKIVSGIVAEEKTNLDLSPYSSKRFN